MKKKEIKKIKNNFSYWENLISQYWKINGKFSKLNSEFDLNFEDCLNEKEIENFILEERITGNKKFDIKATPTLIINDKKFDNPQNYKKLKKTIEKLI